MSSCVIGIGNPYRTDDAIGWLIVDALVKYVSDRVVLSKQGGDITRLLDKFSEYENVYLLDACKINLPIGQWIRYDTLENMTLESAQTSTHGLGISQAIALAKNLDQLPKKLIIYAISCRDFSMGESAVADFSNTINEIVESILQEEDIRLCMNKV